jgi:hypothetical protein
LTERKELGCIRNATFGYGGYQDAMFGFGVTLAGEAWGVSDFTGSWPKRPARASYTAEEHQASLLEGVTRLHETLRAAKRQHVAELVGTPIEATFEGGTLKSWRVLTEVIR